MSSHVSRVLAQMNDLPITRDGVIERLHDVHMAVAVPLPGSDGRKILLLGGNHPEGGSATAQLADEERKKRLIYDLDTRTFDTVSFQKQTRIPVGAVVVSYSEAIYVFGGYHLSALKITVANTQLKRTYFLNLRRTVQPYRAAYVVMNKKLYYFGGMRTESCKVKYMLFQNFRRCPPPPSPLPDLPYRPRFLYTLKGTC